MMPLEIKKPIVRVGAVALFIWSAIAIAQPENISFRTNEVARLLPFPGNFDSVTNSASTLWKELDAEFSRLSPLSELASVPSESADAKVSVDPRPLTERLISFATKGPESPYGWVRHGWRTVGIAMVPNRVWDRKFTDEEVEQGRIRNKMARSIIAKNTTSALCAGDRVQLSYFEAMKSLWVEGESFQDGCASASIRREEDGIPSAEALLAWFAENEGFCESVRADAKARLEKLKKMPTPKLDSSPVATIDPFGCCIADVDVGQLTNGLDRLSFAPQLAEQLANAAVGDAALIESLFSEWTALEPTAVMATNRLFVPVGSTNAVPDSTPLRIRMARFATEGPEQRLARVPGEVTAGYGSGPRMAWRLQYTEAEVAAGRHRNHLARLLTLREISLGYDEMDDEVREDYYATAQSFWIDVNPVRYGAGRASERREEDGIPSVESLLSWFATNVSSTAEIQEDANWRLSLLSGIQGNEP